MFENKLSNKDYEHLLNLKKEIDDNNPEEVQKILDCVDSLRKDMTL